MSLTLDLFEINELITRGAKLGGSPVFLITPEQEAFMKCIQCGHQTPFNTRTGIEDFFAEHDVETIFIDSIPNPQILFKFQ